MLISFAQGDHVIPNSTTGNLLRAGDLTDRTLYFHALDAYASIGVTNPDAAAIQQWLFTLTPPGQTWAVPGQESIATFLASDGHTITDHGTGPLFDTPFEGPLP